MANPFDQFDAAPAPQRQLNPVDDFGALVAQFPGVKVSSLRRSPAKNAGVGGVINSFHMTGEGGDFVVPAEARDAFRAAAQQMGYQAIDEGDHVHLEPPGRGMTATSFAPGQAVANPFDQFEAVDAESPFQVSATTDTTEQKVAPQRGPMAQMIVDSAGGAAPARPAPTNIVERGQQGMRNIAPFAHSTLQGASFGFSDELAGLMGSLGGGDYTEARDAERRRAAQASEVNPTVAAASGLVGGLLVPGGAAKAAVTKGAPRLIARIGRGAATGAGLGALGGAGVSEGDSALEVLGDSARGTVFGGLLGGALPVATSLAGAGVNIGRNLISPATGARAEAGAERAVASAMQRGGTTTDDIRKILGTQTDLSAKPEMLVDLAGNPAQRQLFATRVAGGEGAQNAVTDVVERAREAGTRVGTDVQKAVAPRGQSFQALTGAIEKRRATANKLYENAYKHGVLKSPAINEVFDNPELRGEIGSAYEQTRRGLAMQGEPVPEIFRVGQGGLFERVRAPTVQDAHTLKRALDARITSAFKAGDSSALIQGLKAQREKLVTALKGEVPAYANAAKVYRGDLELEEALTNGREMILNRPVDELRAVFSKLPEAEKDAFRMGAVDTILSQKVDRATDTGDFARRLWGNADIRNRLTMLGQTPKSVETLAREMQREGRMQGTYQSLMGNSATAMRQADLEQLSEDSAANLAATIWQTFGRGDVLGGIRMGMSQARALTSGLRGETADAAAKILTAQGPKDIESALSRLDKAQREQVLRELQGAQARIAGTAAISGAGPTLVDD